MSKKLLKLAMERRSTGVKPDSRPSGAQEMKNVFMGQCQCRCGDCKCNCYCAQCHHTKT